MITSLIKINKDKHISVEISQHENGQLSSIVFFDTGGWVDQYRNGETLYQVIVSEIKAIRSKLKEKKKDSSLKWLLSEFEQERIVHSQLTLF